MATAMASLIEVAFPPHHTPGFGGEPTALRLDEPIWHARHSFRGSGAFEIACGCTRSLRPLGALAKRRAGRRRFGNLLAACNAADPIPSRPWSGY